MSLPYGAVEGRSLQLHVGMTLRQAEVVAVIQALEETGWNARALARVLGMSREAVYLYLRRRGIDVATRTLDPEGEAAKALAKKVPGAKPVPTVREKVKPYAPCPICQVSYHLEPNPTGHQKELICMRPNCIYQRALDRQAKELLPERAIA